MLALSVILHSEVDKIITNVLLRTGTQSKHGSKVNAYSGIKSMAKLRVLQWLKADNGPSQWSKTDNYPIQRSMV